MAVVESWWSWGGGIKGRAVLDIRKTVQVMFKFGEKRIKQLKLLRLYNDPHEGVIIIEKNDHALSNMSFGILAQSLGP